MKLLVWYARTVVFLLAGVGALSVLSLQMGWLAAPDSLSAQFARVSPWRGAIFDVVGHRAKFSDLIYVDTAKTYRLSANFHVMTNATGLSTSRIYFGIHAYDKEGNPINVGTGPYRYPAAQRVEVSSLDGWVRMQGQISGEADNGQDSFPVGTKSIRLVVIPNYGANDIVTQVADVEIAQLADLHIEEEDAAARPYAPLPAPWFAWPWSE